MFRFIVFTAIIACVFGATIPPGLVPKLDGRIVGGEDTTIEEFPHQVSLRAYSYYLCGGSIYNERVIITAAHCLEFMKPSFLSVVAGTTYVNQAPIKIRVEQFYVHEGYSPDTMNNDIAIVILKTPLQFGDTIQPIPLQEQDVEVETGSSSLVSGWGNSHEKGRSANVLKYVELSVIDYDVCSRAYNNRITKAMMCAGHENGGRDSCQGDSGGPLISNGKLIGVVSWGWGCGRPQYPGIYSKISYLHNWIKRTIELI